MRRFVLLALRRVHRGESGQAAMEFVVVLPVILVFFFLIAEGTKMLSTWVNLEYATREGARSAAVRNNATTVTNVVIDRTGGLITASNVTVTNAQGTLGSDTQVSVTYNYTYNFPLQGLVQLVMRNSWTPPPVTMTAQTHMRLE